MGITINLGRDKAGSEESHSHNKAGCRYRSEGSSVSRRFLTSTEDGLVSIIRNEKIDYKS